MSRTKKSKSHVYAYKSPYKAARVRKERAKLREALGSLKTTTPIDRGDWEDRCGNDDCHICGTQYAPDAGPTYELEPFDHWAYD